MNEKWVIFDFDGTISETTDVLAKFWNEYMAQKYKLRKITADDLENLRNMNTVEKIAYLRIPFYKMPFVINSARKHFSKYMNEFSVLPGFREIIRKFLDSGLKLAIVSSNKEENIRKYLAKSNFEFFTDVFCDKGRSLFVKHKTLKKFLKIHNISPENAVYIGDESRDVVACKKVGIEVISVTWGWDSRDVLELVNPKNLADTPQQMLEKVAEILNIDTLKQ